MTAHDHREIVPGCYRCELNADELDPRFEVSPAMSDTEKAWKPTTEQIRAAYGWFHRDSYVPSARTAALGDFDRWLAAHDAEVRAAALEEAEKAVDGTRTGWRDTDYSEGQDDGINVAVDVIRALRSTGTEGDAE